MKILIIGASGFLGNKFVKILSKNNEIIKADISPKDESFVKLDATNKKEVENLLLLKKPDVVIDTVALTSSISCEKDPELAKKLNFETAKNIAQICKKIKAIMIFISSAYIFDGKKGDYSEQDKVSPQNIYGKTKVLAEKEVMKISNSIILRIDIMYGYNGKNESNGVFGTIFSGNQINLREPHQLRQPIFVDDVVKITLKLLEKNEKGIFHLAGTDKMFMIDFLKNLESLIRNESKVNISNSQDNSFEISIPKNSTLNNSKIINLGIKPSSFEEGLKILKKQLKD